MAKSACDAYLLVPSAEARGHGMGRDRGGLLDTATVDGCVRQQGLSLRRRRGCVASHTVALFAAAALAVALPLELRRRGGGSGSPPLGRVSLQAVAGGLAQPAAGAAAEAQQGTGAQGSYLAGWPGAPSGGQTALGEAQQGTGAQGSYLAGWPGETPRGLPGGLKRPPYSRTPVGSGGANALGVAVLASFAPSGLAWSWSTTIGPRRRGPNDTAEVKDEVLQLEFTALYQTCCAWRYEDGDWEEDDGGSLALGVATPHDSRGRAPAGAHRVPPGEPPAGGAKAEAHRDPDDPDKPGEAELDRSKLDFNDPERIKRLGLWRRVVAEDARP
ncbi:unnamed protein product [Prorocentrum cordatum]|uniref:Uncharacterized protein n=1 Tax=Prorocentrum cordatum TaxID=2364126 RepID=A0ABN9SI20_9DINO|nr:unnamed protein product [Polarella glacialis]